MKLVKYAYAILVAVTIAAPNVALAASAHDHPAPAAALRLDHDRKWETDAPLRRGMATMRTELVNRLPAIHDGRLGQEEFGALATLMERQIGVIVSECKLKPEADAMLHLVLADLAHAADAMQGKIGTNPVEGAEQAIAALNAYGEYFDHPGWTRIQ